MARHTGEGGVLEIDGTIVGKVNGWSMSSEASVATGRSLGETWDENAPTSQRWSGSAEVDIDDADAGQLLLRAGATGNLKMYTEGDAVGKQEFAGDIVVTGRSPSVSKDGYVTASISFTGNGALTETTLV